jgi:hypothetical protein
MFRKNPITYLNSRSWENEIISEKTTTTHPSEIGLSRAEQGARKRKERTQKLKLDHDGKN